jgi:DNA-binding MarR family transcriptional regulator
MPVELSQLDLGTLALFVGQACGDEVQSVLARRGFDDVRVSHGYVFQHLVEGPRPITELARRLEVSQQAVSKTVAEMVRLGYVELSGDEADARRKQVGLSKRGKAVIEAARRARAAQEARLERRFGAAELARCRRLLATILDGLGGTDAVRNRRVRAPR